MSQNKTYCAIYKDEIVGVIMYSDESLILLNYVDPDYQGIGIGKALLLKVEKIQGQGKLLSVESTKTALGFYQRHGFNRVQGKNYVLQKETAI